MWVPIWTPRYSHWDLQLVIVFNYSFIYLALSLLCIRCYNKMKENQFDLVLDDETESVCVYSFDIPILLWIKSIMNYKIFNQKIQNITHSSWKAMRVPPPSYSKARVIMLETLENSTPNPLKLNKTKKK